MGRGDFFYSYFFFFISGTGGTATSPDFLRSLKPEKLDGVFLDPYFHFYFIYTYFELHK